MVWMMSLVLDLEWMLSMVLVLDTAHEAALGAFPEKVYPEIPPGPLLNFKINKN